MPATAVSTFDSVYLGTVASPTPLPAEEIKGTNSFDQSDERTTVSALYLGDAVETFIPAHRSVSFTLSGHAQPGDAGPHDAAKAAYVAGTLVYFYVTTNPAGAPGTMGIRYQCYVTAYTQKFATGDVITFDMTLSLATPTVLAY